MNSIRNYALVAACFALILLFSLQQVVVFNMLGSGVSLGTVAILVFVVVAPIALLLHQGVPSVLRLPLTGVLGCLVVLSVSALLSDHFVTALKFAVRYGTELILLWVFLNFARLSPRLSRSMARAAIWFLVGALVIGAGTFFGNSTASELSLFFHSDGTFKYLPRISAIYEHPGIFASIGVIVAMLSLHMRQMRIIGRMELFVGVISGVAAMVLAQTRNVFLALLLVVLTFLLFGRVRGKKLPIWAWLSTFVALVAVFAAMYLLRYENIVQLKYFHGNLDHLTSGRIYLWQAAIQAWLDYPWFGTGPGVFPLLTPEYTNGRFYAGEFHAHNLVLGILSETGLMGLIACAWLLYALLKPLFDATKTRHDGLWVVIWLVLMVSLGGADFYFYSYGFALHCVVVIAYLYGEYFVGEQKTYYLSRWLRKMRARE